MVSMHTDNCSLMYGTSDQEGSTGLFVKITTYKFGCKEEDVGRPSERTSGTGETIQEANGTDPVSRSSEKKASIISGTPEPLTHLQLNVAKRGNFNALRVAAQDHLITMMHLLGRPNPGTHTRRKSDGSRCHISERECEKESKIQPGQEKWQEKKRKPLEQRIRRNDNRRHSTFRT